MIVVKRKIGSIQLDVTVSEKHSDTLEITQFPVLSGAVITDHAYKLPMQLTIKGGQGTGKGQYAYGVNPESIITADIPNDNGQYAFEEDDSYTITGGDINRPARTYKDLLALQASREPFTVITGKRVYKNMLIKNLSVTTEQDTENVLMFTADLQEVIIVSTATYGKTSGAIKAQMEPSTTDTKSTSPKDKSTLKSLSDTEDKKAANEILDHIEDKNKKETTIQDPGTITPKHNTSVLTPNRQEIDQLREESPLVAYGSITKQLELIS
jgi:hypothetical protein